MKRYKLLSAVMLLLTLTAGFQSCQSTKSATGSKMIRFNFEKGKGYNYNMVYDIDTKEDNETNSVSIDSDYSMKIVDDNGKIKSISTEYEKLQMNVKSKGMTVEMGSITPSEVKPDYKTNPLAAMKHIFNGMMNKPFIIKVDEEGNVLEVNGFEKILESMIDSLPMQPQAKQQSKILLKEQFNDQSLKDNFAQVFTIFPNKEVKIGDIWDKSYVTSGKMAANYTTRYTVKDIDGDHVTLATKTRISSTGGTTEVEGDQTGKILMDSKTGLLINATFDQDMKVKSEGKTVKIIGKGKISGRAM